MLGFLRTLKFEAAVAAMAVMLIAVSTQSYAENGRVQITFVKAGRIVDGIGYLFYEANRYRLDVSGISSEMIRIKRVNLVGTALNLRTAADIVGTYTAVDAASTVVGHANQARLKNANGAILEVDGVNLARKFSLNLAGMTITSPEWEPRPQ